MSKKQLYYIFTAKIVRSQYFRIVYGSRAVEAQRTYFFVYCRVTFALALGTKDLTFGPGQATIQPLSGTEIAQLHDAVGRLIYTT